MEYSVQFSNGLGAFYFHTKVQIRPVDWVDFLSCSMHFMERLNSPFQTGTKLDVSLFTSSVDWAICLTNNFTWKRQNAIGSSWA